MTAPKPSRLTAWLTVPCLILGIGLGLIVFHWKLPLGLAAADNVAALGTLWTNALRMTIIPLILSTLVVAVAGGSNPKGVSRLSGITFATFFSLLILGATLVVIVVPPILPRLFLHGEQSISTTAAPASALTSKESGAPADASFKSLISTLIPSNLIKAAADDDLLPIVLFSVMLGLAVTRLDHELRVVFVSVMRAISNSIGIVIKWILVLTPIGVFAFSFSATATVGWDTFGILGTWVVLVSVLSLLLAGILYLLAMSVGGVRLADFAKALANAQSVGVTTRSSMAALPAMLEGATRHLRIRQTVKTLVLPLSVSSFKINRSINGTARLLFVAHIYGVPLGPMAITGFVLGNILMSFSSPGLPAKGPGATLPLYLAVGLPLEGILLLKAVDSLTDFAMTFLNVTGDMTALAIIERLSRGKSDEETLYSNEPQSAGTLPASVEPYT